MSSMRLGCATTWALISLTIGTDVAAQAVAPPRSRQVELGRVLPFQLPEVYCLENVRTAFPRVATGARWQDVVATALAIAEVLRSSSQQMVKVSVTRDDLNGIALPDKYYRLAEVYLDPGKVASLEVAQKPYTAAALRAYHLREQLAAKAIDKGVDEIKAYARANAEALRRLHLSADTRMPPMLDYEYMTSVARSELQVEISTDARVALERIRSKCP